MDNQFRYNKGKQVASPQDQTPRQPLDPNSTFDQQYTVFHEKYSAFLEQHADFTQRNATLNEQFSTFERQCHVTYDSDSEQPAVASSSVPTGRNSNNPSHMAQPEIQQRESAPQATSSTNTSANWFTPSPDTPLERSSPSLSYVERRGIPIREAARRFDSPPYFPTAFTTPPSLLPPCYYPSPFNTPPPLFPPSYYPRTFPAPAPLFPSLTPLEARYNPAMSDDLLNFDFPEDSWLPDSSSPTQHNRTMWHSLMDIGSLHSPSPHESSYTALFRAFDHEEARRARASRREEACRIAPPGDILYRRERAQLAALDLEIAQRSARDGEPVDEAAALRRRTAIRGGEMQEEAQARKEAERREEERRRNAWRELNGISKERPAARTDPFFNTSPSDGPHNNDNNDDDDNDDEYVTLPHYQGWNLYDNHLNPSPPAFFDLHDPVIPSASLRPGVFLGDVRVRGAMAGHPGYLRSEPEAEGAGRVSPPLPSVLRVGP